MTYESTNIWDSSVDSYYVMNKPSGPSSVAGSTYGTGESAVPSSYNFEPVEHVPEFPDRFCFEMVTYGSCKFGNNCRYAHTEPAVHKPEFPNKVCKDWEADQCTRGNFCKFAHPSKFAVNPIRKGGVGHVGKVSKRQRMKAAAALKTNLRSMAKVASTERPATLRQLQAYVSKCLKDNKFPAFPKKISMGLSYYDLPFPNAKFYPQQPYQELLAEIKLRLVPQKTLLAVPNYDTMSTMSSSSTHSWKSVSVTRSVIQEELFNKKCKGSGGKASWSENSSVVSAAGSAMSYNPAQLNATGIQVVPRPETKAPTPVAVKRVVVVCKAGVPIYNKPNWQEQIGGAKFLSAFTVKSRSGPWVETEKGWMLERHNPTGARFLVPAKAENVLVVKLPAGHSLSVRKEPRMDCKEIVGKLVNGDVIVACGKYGNWVKHADGWSLRKNRTAVFIEEANARLVRNTSVRHFVNGTTLKERAPPVCFSWLENRGKCTKPDCMFSHEFPTKETYRSGQQKLCRAHHQESNCKYARWPRACRFSHAKPVAAKPTAKPAVKPVVKPVKAQVFKPAQACLFQALKAQNQQKKGVRVSNLNFRPRKI